MTPTPQTTPQTIAEHADFVRALARSLVLDANAADDVAQDTWLAALERPTRSSANPRAWLARIATRFAARGRRSAARRQQRESSAARPESLESADEGLARAELLRRVTDAVVALEDPYRSVVLLRFYEGLDAVAIAARTGAPVATVRSRLQRALAQLRERLDREHGGERDVWCQGLVALLSGNRTAGTASASSAAGGGAGAGVSVGVGVGAGAVTMSTAVKVSAGVVAAAALVLVWRATQARDPGSSAAASEGTVANLVAAAPAVGTTSSLAAREPAERSSLAERAKSVAATGAVEVHVTWARDGRPAAGEELHFLAWEHPSGGRAKHGFADEQGRFRLEGLSPGNVVIGTSHGGDGEAVIRAGETTSVELEIAKGFAVRGRVVDAAGQPVPRARLWLSEYFNYTEGSVVGSTRPDGTFALEDVPEARYLGAIADGLAPAHLHLLRDEQPPDQPLADVELTLTMNGEGGRLALRITAADGTPVEGALVRASGALPASVAAGNNRTLSMIPGFEAWSDAEGRAVIDGLSPGTAELVILAAGMGVWKDSTSIEAGRTRELVVALQPEGVVTGTVRAPDGTPLKEARVFLDEEYDPLRPSARCDDEGYYELRGLPSGDLSLKASEERAGSATTHVQVGAGATVSWDPVLATGRVLTGRVLDEEGAPLAGWWVEMQIGIYSPWRAQTQTDAEGKYSLVDLKPGPLVLELSRDNLLEQIPTLRRVVDEGVSVLDLRVAHADLCDAGLTARFLDPEGRPIVGALVALWVTGASSAPNFESDSQGLLRAEHLHPGAYELTASFPEGPSLFLGRVELGPEEQRDLGTIALEAPGAVRITVNGAPLLARGPFRSFSYLQLDDAGRSRWSASARGPAVDDDTSLQPGRYLLEAYGAEGTADERVTFELRAEERKTIDLVPRAGRLVSLAVDVRAGSPTPEWMRITVRDGSGSVLRELTASMNVEGRFSWGLSLAPGIHELEAEAADGRRVLAPFEVTLGAGPLQVHATVR